MSALAEPLKNALEDAWIEGGFPDEDRPILNAFLRSVEEFTAERDLSLEEQVAFLIQLYGAMRLRLQQRRDGER